KAFKSHSARSQHILNSPKHNICADCSMDFSTLKQLLQHDVAKHNMCETCRSYFDSPSNLRNHYKTHMKKSTECPGCSRRFALESVMVLHLKAETCESGADNEYVTNIAFDCHQARMYTCDDFPDFNFKCLTCDTPFIFMSAVLQHVESDCCDETLAHGTPLAKFLRFLRS
ncbi:hypothetical protein QBC46DRAFT_270067, partial [Diplogelasinospora grovesii]